MIIYLTLQQSKEKYPNWYEKRIIKNKQVLWKYQQDKEINQIILEDPFKEVDEKLGD